MAIEIKFDASNQPELPTLVLTTQNGDRIGCLSHVSDIKINDNMNSANEISFVVHEYIDDNVYPYWDEIRSFRLIYVVEWKKYFVMDVSIDESDECTKYVNCTSLQEYELSQLRLYGIHINTDEDIEREDYTPTVLYNSENAKASLLDRLLSDKAPYYTIIHVDKSISNMQRTFNFDGISIYDAFMEVAKELNCLFVFGDSDTNSSAVYGDSDCTIPIFFSEDSTDEITFNNLPLVYSSPSVDFSLMRTIAVYDLESTCNDCGYRGEFTIQCPKCKSKNIFEGYGNDTTIFASIENLTENIDLTTDTEAVKNCFHLEAGDDLMTATVINANPSGSQYLWYFSEDMKRDMSDDLREKLSEYDSLYDYYSNTYSPELDLSLLQQYNQLITKYQKYDKDLVTISLPIIGYSQLMKIYYDTIDFYGYLYNSLLPSVDTSGTSAKEQAALLTADNLSPVSVENTKYISLATANSTILGYAKVFIDTARYKVKVKSSSINGTQWTGILTIENYYDEEDVADSNTVTVLFNDDYESFIKQKIDKSLSKSKDEDLSIVSLFKLEKKDFSESLKQYSYTHLQIISDACQSCLDILIEEGLGNNDSWKYTEGNVYQEIYLPFYEKKNLINSELLLRENELAVINGTTDEYGDVDFKGLKNCIEDTRNIILEKLDFQSFVGDYWAELNLFRREDSWSNDNYMSDGLNNSELFENANKFLEAATKDIHKAAELQYLISCPLKNLLILDEFKDLVQYFKIGNWIRISVDNNIYKLRLISYEIDYNSLDTISVEFSETKQLSNSINDVETILNQSKSIAKSYTSTKRQAEKGQQGNDVIDNWFENGIDATTTKVFAGDNNDIVCDKHGLLFRKYDPLLNDYSPTQLKIINSTLAITNDNWKTSKVGVGEFEFYNPKTQQMETGYGLIADQIVGGLMLSKEIGIYNSAGTMTFDDENGLSITNGINTFTVDPNNKSLLSIKKGDVSVFTVTDTGELTFTGNVTANQLVLGSNGLYESNGITSVSISPKGTSIFTLQKGSEKVLYFDSDGELNIKGKVQASSFILDSKIDIDAGTISGFNITDKSIFCSNSSSNYSGFSSSSESPLLFAGDTNPTGDSANFKLYHDGYCVIKDSKFEIQNSDNQKIFWFNSNNINILDAWNNASNLVTSGENEKIKITLNDDILEFWVGTNLVAQIYQGFVGSLSS